ncbi:MAG: DUF4922 domain-containing protein [Bacteroidales bacterium]|nr:DUF4922 domain-containing protein [Bacteroidales bacterium]
MPIDYTSKAELLLLNQLRCSDLFNNNFRNMHSSMQRIIEFDGFSYTLQLNPARIKSAAADTSKPLDSSKCFLCKDNLLENQIIEEFNSEFYISVNPFPIGENHFTIISKNHINQGIMDMVELYIESSMMLPNYCVFYNGPHCGASAPFHRHFQACKADCYPLYNQIESLKRYTTKKDEFVDTIIYKIDDTTRNFILIETSNQTSATHYLNTILSDLSIKYNESEPEVNIGSTYRNGYFSITIFPRAKHRPEEFYKDEEHRILCSPGYADLAGLMPICLVRNFETISQDNIRSIMKQVLRN